MSPLRTPMMSHAVRTYQQRAPRGPRPTIRRPDTDRGMSLAVLGMALAGGVMAVGSASAAPASAGLAPGSGVTPCLGSLSISAPTVASAGSPLTIRVSYHLLAGPVKGCTSNLQYSYFGLPAGMVDSHSAVDTGVPTHIGTYHTVVTVTAGMGPTSRAATITIVPGMV